MLGLLLVTAGCAAPAPTAERLVPDYQGIETRLFANDLVRFDVAMTNALTSADVEDYADCAAAGYTLIRGWGFARHVKTDVTQEDTLWRGQAVYTISASLPRGVQTLDAEVIAAACAEKGIPTV